MKERINYNNGYYYGDVSTTYRNGSFIKIKHGMGTYYWNDGTKLEGTYMNDNILSGSYTFPDGTVYSGNFVNWSFDGFGTMKWPNGDVYVGNFSNGNRTGQGKVTFAVGGYYEGQFLEGYRHGQGKNVFPNNSIYVGTYVKDKKEGKGRMEYSDGGYYDGEWKNDLRHGFGEWVYTDNAKYNGYLKDDKRDGEGTLVWHDTYYGSTFMYKGGWKNNCFDGTGVIYGGGYKYEGEVAASKDTNGQLKGNGILYFVEDLMDENDIDTLVNENYEGNFSYRYIGGFNNTLFHGQGTLSIGYASTIFSGMWINGKLNGPAVKMCCIDEFRIKGQEPTFDVYEGTCVNNKFVGIVKVTRANGTVENISASEAEKVFEDDFEYFKEYIFEINY